MTLHAHLEARLGASRWFDADVAPSGPQWALLGQSFSLACPWRSGGLQFCKNLGWQGVSVSKFLSLALLFAVLSVASAQSLVYKNAKEGFQIGYPKGWTVREGMMGTTVFIAKVNPNGFSTNVNVVIQPVPAGTTVQGAGDATTAQLKTVITDFKLLSQKDTTLSGQPALALSYTGKQGQYALRWYQVLSVRGSKAFVVTFTTEAAKYAAESAPLQGILDSFKYL